MVTTDGAYRSPLNAPPPAGALARDSAAPARPGRTPRARVPPAAPLRRNPAGAPALHAEAAADRSSAPPGRELTTDRIEQGALACAIRPQDAENLTGPQVHVDPAKRYEHGGALRDFLREASVAPSRQQEGRAGQDHGIAPARADG